MATYLVTWDLNREASQYRSAREVLLTAIRHYPYVKEPGLDSVVFIESSESPEEIAKYLHRVGRLDSNDSLVVTRMRPKENWGWLPGSGTWNWLTARMV